LVTALLLVVEELLQFSSVVGWLHVVTPKPLGVFVKSYCKTLNVCKIFSHKFSRIVRGIKNLKKCRCQQYMGKSEGPK